MRASGPTVKTTTGAAAAEWVFGSGDDWLCRGTGCETASGVRTELQVVTSLMATWRQFQLQNVSRINRCIGALLMKGLKSSAAGRTYREAPPTSTATPRFDLHSFPKLSIRSDGRTVCLSGLNACVPFFGPSSSVTQWVMWPNRPIRHTHFLTVLNAFFKISIFQDKSSFF